MRSFASSVCFIRCAAFTALAVATVHCSPVYRQSSGRSASEAVGHRGSVGDDNASDDALVGEQSIDVPQRGSIIPALVEASRRRGCNVLGADERAMKVRCEEGYFGAEQDGSQFTYACSRNLTAYDCRQLMLDLARIAKRD